MITKRIIVSGLVQGVGFRWATQRLAKELKVKGTVKNLSNGQVEIIAQGDALQLAHFLSQVKVCPTPAGRVDQVEVSDVALTDHFHSFHVIY